MIKKISKRDGTIVQFEKKKIKNAIIKAMMAVEEKNAEEKAERVTERVVERVEKKVREERERDWLANPLNVEEIQDIVEESLILEDFAKVAKAYILYRQKRAEIRELQKEILNGRTTRMKPLSINALRVLAGRYLQKDYHGKVIETPEEMFERVARVLAEVERVYGRTEREIKKFYNNFREIMINLEFLPGGRTLTNAGASTKLVSNCIVLHMEDSMEGIFDTLKDAALLQQAGSGLGFPFHLLRPAGSLARSSHGVASGPVSFMKTYDAAFGTIKQQGRHGANMAVMSVKHPDILEFIWAKEKEGVLKNFNISVGLTDDFMRAVVEDSKEPWLCEFRGIKMKPRRITRDVYETILEIKEETMTAREIMEEIVRAAWNNGEPGVVFLDTVNKKDVLPYLGRIEACNPCGEQFLHDGDVCNLGSINLEKFVKNKEVDWERLRFVVENATRMLDNVVEISDFPVKKVQDMARANRRIGLGVMGFADMLILLGIPYNSKEGRKKAEEVMGFIQKTAHNYSVMLAEEKGVFPNWHKSIWREKNIKRRNAALTTIAPTGTISMICDVSSGIEPYFALVYEKREVMGKESMYYVNKHLEKILRERGLYREEVMRKIVEKGSLYGIDEIPKDLKEIFAVSLDIKPEDHVLMQAAFQKHVENSISKTINFPYGAGQDDVYKAYVLAWQEGCKGLTVYRSGSRQVEVLKLVKEEKKTKENKKTETKTIYQNGKEALQILGKKEINGLKECPECGSRSIVKGEGCFTCKDCGFSICSF